MKLLSQTVLAAIISLSGFAYSGDFFYATPAKSPVCSHTGYIFAYGGYFGDQNVDGNEPRFPSNEKLEFDDGYIIGGGVGIYSCLWGGSRFEIEGIHAQNDIGRITSDIFDGNGFQNFGFTGELEKQAIMVNYQKEIPLGAFTGYVGAGLGLVENNLTIFNNVNQANTESDAVFGYQFMAGVDIPVAKCVDLFLQYKALGVEDAHFEKIDLVIDSHFTHNFVFGARVSF